MKTRQTLLILLLFAFAQSKGAVSFYFETNSCPFAYDQRNPIEKNISKLLNNIQSASQSGKPISYKGIKIEQGAIKKLNALWENLPFSIDESDIREKCYKDMQGYQIRGIDITIHPVIEDYTGSIDRELTISFKKDGTITGVIPALESHIDQKTIMGEGKDVEDVMRRREILKWVEDFRNYYNEHDIKSIEDIFSDNALIITGSVTTRSQKNDFGVYVNEESRYKKQTKAEYIKSLQGIFGRNKYIDVKFDRISVVGHHKNPNIYGVTLWQSWRTGSSAQNTRYKDEGMLFLLWDFTNPEKPQIHVRTWQSAQDLMNDEAFSLHDFTI